jgi:hypothetical protein
MSEYDNLVNFVNESKRYLNNLPEQVFPTVHWFNGYINGQRFNRGLFRESLQPDLIDETLSEWWEYWGQFTMCPQIIPMSKINWDSQDLSLWYRWAKSVDWFKPGDDEVF